MRNQTITHANQPPRPAESDGARARVPQRICRHCHIADVVEVHGSTGTDFRCTHCGRVVASELHHAARPLAVVLDDDPTVRTGVVAALEASGYGAVALAPDSSVTSTCLDTSLDVLITDPRLSQVDLVTLIAQLRLLRRGSPPVILYSRNVRQSDSRSQSLFAFGDVHFVRKADGHDAVVALVTQLVSPIARARDVELSGSRKPLAESRP